MPGCSTTSRRASDAELAQRDSEERTRLIIAAIKDHAIYMLDADGRIASWNRGATELTGYDGRRRDGPGFRACSIRPTASARPTEALTIAVRDGWIEEECWHLRRDGSRYRGDDMISAIHDDAGALRGFSVVTRDATQRIELREQTERSRDFYFALFSDIPNLVWRCDVSGGCDYVNNAWLDYTGRARADELVDGWKDGMHPDDRPAWQQRVRRRRCAAASRSRSSSDCGARSGEWGSLICSGRPYHDMKGGFCGFLCSCFDNTERRNMESALKESEQRYEAMTSNVPGMVFQLVRRAEGGYAFAYVSHGCEPLTGLSEANLRQDAGSVLRAGSGGRSRAPPRDAGRIGDAAVDLELERPDASRARGHRKVGDDPGPAPACRQRRDPVGRRRARRHAESPQSSSRSSARAKSSAPCRGTCNRSARRKRPASRASSTTSWARR